MIKGIDPSPKAVGNHFAARAGTVIGLLVTANREALTIWLMASPGIVTLARVCHCTSNQWNIRNILYIEDIYTNIHLFRLTKSVSAVAAAASHLELESFQVSLPEVAASAKQ